MMLQDGPLSVDGSMPAETVPIESTFSLHSTDSSAQCPNSSGSAVPERHDTRLVSELAILQSPGIREAGHGRVDMSDMSMILLRSDEELKECMGSSSQPSSNSHSVIGPLRSSVQPNPSNPFSLNDQTTVMDAAPCHTTAGM